MAELMRKVGSHELSIEGDVVVCRYHGAITLEEIQKIHLLLAEQLHTGGSTYQLCDLRDVGSVPADVRAFIARWSKEHRLTAIVMFGASLLVRAATTMTERLASLLHHSDAPPVKFFPAETGARKWIEEHRKQRGRAAASMM